MTGSNMTADLIVECTAQNPGKRVPVELPAFAAMVAEHMQWPDNVVPLPVVQVEPSVSADTAPLSAIDHQSDIDALLASVERLAHEAEAARAWATQFESALSQVWEGLGAINDGEVTDLANALDELWI